MPSDELDWDFYHKDMLSRVDRELDEIFLTYGVHPTAIKRIRELSGEYQEAIHILAGIIIKRSI